MNNIKDILPAFSEAEISTALNIYSGNVDKAVDSLLDVNSKTHGIVNYCRTFMAASSSPLVKSTP